MTRQLGILSPKSSSNKNAELSLVRYWREMTRIHQRFWQTFAVITAHAAGEQYQKLNNLWKNEPCLSRNPNRPFTGKLWHRHVSVDSRGSAQLPSSDAQEIEWPQNEWVPARHWFFCLSTSVRSWVSLPEWRTGNSFIRKNPFWESQSSLIAAHPYPEDTFSLTELQDVPNDTSW